MHVGVNAIGNDDLAQIRDLGCSTYRTEIYPDADALRVAVVLTSVVAGLRPLVLLKLERATSLEQARAHAARVIDAASALGLEIDLEVMNEPNLKSGQLPALLPSRAAELCRVVVDVAESRQFSGRIYGGSVSNLSQAGLQYLDLMDWDTLPERLAVAVHRYPDRLDPQSAHTGFASREDEWAELRDIVGLTRPIAVTEVGYHTAVETWGWWIFTQRKQLTDPQVGDCLRWELDFWQRVGADAVYIYQWNDGADPTHYNDHFGLRAVDKTLKPQAHAVSAWVATNQPVPIPLPEPKTMRVSLWRDGAWYTPTSARLRLDDPAGTTIEGVIEEVEPGQSRPRFDLPSWAVFTHGASITVDDFPPNARIILGPDVNHHLPDTPKYRPARTGLVRTRGRVFFDDDGEWLPLGASFFTIPSRLKDEPERTDRNLAYHAERNVDVLRWFACVGGTSWQDREIGPETPGYGDLLARSIDHPYDAFGCRSFITCLAGSDKDTPERNWQIVRAVAAALQGREHKVFAAEISNEANGASIEQIRELTNWLQTQTDVLVAPTRAWGHCDEEQGAYAEGVGDVTTFHPDRTVAGTDGIWRYARQGWELIQGCAHLPQAGIVGEPKGPRSSVSMDDDPERQATLWADCIVSGVAAFIYHCGPGVRLGGAWDLNPPGGAFWAPRESNFDEVPNGDAILRALNVVRDVMPVDAPNWTKVNGHWAANPLRPDLFYVDGHARGVARAHGATQSGRFAVVYIDVRDHVNVTALHACEFDLYSPIRGHLRRVTLQAGHQHQFTESDGKGLIAVGRFL